MRAAPEPVRVLRKLKIDQKNLSEPKLNGRRQKVMKNALITIALAGLAMRPENVLAMSLCDGTKITAECVVISNSTDCSADANCEWDGSSCGASSALGAEVMAAATQDVAAAAAITVTCRTASSCTGDCETSSDGTCIGTKAYFKSEFTDDALATSTYLSMKCDATGESDCVAVSDCEWDATETPPLMCSEG